MKEYEESRSYRAIKIFFNIMKWILALVFFGMLIAGFITAFSSCIKIYQDPEIRTDTITVHDTVTIHDTITIPAKDYAVWDADGNGYTADTFVYLERKWIWMGENLRTTRYADGTQIPHVTDRIDWAPLQEGAYCWYDKDQTPEYGALYNKYAVYTGKLCPTGWHVPSNWEWMDLVDAFGGEYVAGGKLKDSGTQYWQEPNEGATNESGFSALPAGALFSMNYAWPFLYRGREAYWWTSTVPSDRYNSSMMIEMNYGSPYVNFYENSYIDNQGLSVRCLKDE